MRPTVFRWTGSLTGRYRPTATSGWLPSGNRALELVRDIVPYHMKHNAEPEACDLLMEVDLLPEIKAREHFPFEGTHSMTRSALHCALHSASRCQIRVALAFANRC
jgi:hypothetical protein